MKRHNKKTVGVEGISLKGNKYEAFFGLRLILFFNQSNLWFQKYSLQNDTFFRWLTCFIKRIKQCFEGNTLLSIRIGLVILYFILHSVCLRFDVWVHEVMTQPPPPPEILGQLTGESQEVIKKFTQLVHPHVYGHPHLNVPLVTVFRRSLGLALIEWILLIRLKMIHSDKRRLRWFGLLATLSTFVNVTGMLFGGLDMKTVLFPDLWDYIDFRCQINQVFVEQSLEQILASLEKTFPPFSVLRGFHFLNPSHYLKLGSSTMMTPAYLTSEPIPPFIFPILYVLHLLDIFGALLYLVVMCRFLHLVDIVVPGIILIGVLLTTSFFVSGVPKPNANDYHWIPYNSSRISLNYITAKDSLPPIRITKYIKSKDETLLAADIYIPYHIIHRIVCGINKDVYRKFYSSVFYLNPCKNTVPTLGKSLQIPTFLMVTRYNRRTTLHWPFTFLSFWGQSRGESTTNLWSWQFVDSLVVNDYVLVIADTRGTGASFGTRPVDLSPMEILDLAVIREWVTQQLWYNGKIATGGFSYDGMTGLYLAASQPVQAVLALFTPINVVHDLIQPGGLVCSSFVEDYTGLTHGFETLGSPWRHLLHDRTYDIPLILGFLFVFGHAAPVKSYESFLPDAIQEHQLNWNMTEMVQSVHFSDDFVVVPATKKALKKNLTETYPVSTTRISANQFGISYHVVRHITSRLVKKDSLSGGQQTAAVYIVGGYCDSSSVRGSVRLYEALRTVKTKYTPTRRQYRLTLGPWTHTGRRNCSPFSIGTYSHFEQDMYWDILRFLDFHLKGKEWIGISELPGDTTTSGSNATSLVSDDSPVHFWSLGDERWFASEEYPPRNGTEINYDFSEEIVNGSHKPQQEEYSASICDQASVQSMENQKAFSLYEKAGIGDSWTSEVHPKRYSWGLVMRHMQHHQKFHQVRPVSLKEKRPTSKFICYSVDYNATTRGMSRWVIAKHAFRMGSYSYREMYPSTTSDHNTSLYSTILNCLSNSVKYGLDRVKIYCSDSSLTLPRIFSVKSETMFSVQFFKKLARFIMQLNSLNLELPFFNINYMLLWSSPERQATGDLLTFTSPILKEPLRIVGSPLIRFSINLSEEFTRRVHELRDNSGEQRFRVRVNELDPVPALDVTIFAYIEDIDHEKRKVYYVTEGRILLSHRPTIPESASKIIDGLKDWRGCASPPLSERYARDTLTIRQKPRLGSADLIYQNGDRGSHRFTVGGTECVAFTFEPITWLFQKGHHIRLTLAGADRGNFQWSRTQSKEDVDLLAQSLLFAVKAGNHEWFNEIQRRPVQVERPHTWKIPLNDNQHVAFLKLLAYDNEYDSVNCSHFCLKTKRKRNTLIK